tara:strand:- start:7795 stop:7929 length:135 start_codon:yes stop_codon:yes gene_type:complete
MNLSSAFVTFTHKKPPSEAIVGFCGKPKWKRIKKKGRAEAPPGG